MAKFKVGDRVRRVGASSWPEQYGHVGEEYTVLSVDAGGRIVVIDGKTGADASSFELVPARSEFKAGDRVRCVSVCAGSAFTVGDAVLIPGVISAINQSPRGTNYNIVFETQNRRMSLHFLEEDFIVDEDDGEGDRVCANNDNGPVPTGDTAKAFDALANSIFGLTVRRAA